MRFVLFRTCNVSGRMLVFVDIGIIIVCCFRRSSMKEGTEKIIEIRDASFETAKAMCYFMCVHELPMGKFDIWELLKLGHCYLIKRLVPACFEEIVVKLSIDNFAKAVKFIYKYGSEDEETKKYLEEIVNYGKVHMQALKDNNIWSDLPLSLRFNTWKE